MISLTTYLLAAFGLAYIAGYSKVSLPLRCGLANANSKVIVVLLMLLECPACLGMWIGFLAGSFLPLGFIEPGWINGVYLGLATCGSNLLLARYAGLLGE